ncbi:MAG: VOC family protein [Opitutales bacterium]
MTARTLRIVETCLYATDLEAAEAFYVDVLGLEVVARDPGRHVFFRCGASMVLVFNPTVSQQASSNDDAIDVPEHGSFGPGHVAFALDMAEANAWRAQLAAHAVAIEREFEWPNGSGYSIYFRDPADNSLELVTPRLWGLR